MGAAFYLWDVAMKRGDPRVVGVLAYATPLLSTALLLVVTGRPLDAFRWRWPPRSSSAQRCSRSQLLADRPA